MTTLGNILPSFLSAIPTYLDPQHTFLRMHSGMQCDFRCASGSRGENRVEYLRRCATRGEARTKFLRNGNANGEKEEGAKGRSEGVRRDGVNGRSIAKAEIVLTAEEKRSFFLLFPRWSFFSQRNKTKTHTSLENH